jgi:hypothetical protein
VIRTPQLQKLRPPDTIPKRTNKIPMYYLNKNTSSRFLDLFILNAVGWCCSMFGKLTGDMPQVYWSWDSLILDPDTGEYYDGDFMGNYYRNDELILLRIKGHRNIYNLSHTIIHEYVHYLQPKKGNWYSRWNNSLGYENNPYELEANYIADLYYVECTHEVLRAVLGVKINRG